MTLDRTNLPSRLLWASALSLAVCGIANAQDGRPVPTAPQPQATGDDRANDARPDADWSDRPPAPEGLVTLAFDEVGIRDTIAFIAESTGKVVMPINLAALQNRKITLMNETPIPRVEALDLLFQAFRLNQVGVIEKDDVVIIGMIDEIMLVRQMPVLRAENDVMSRKDKGSLVVKVFKLHEVRAEEVGERINVNLPSYANLTVDPNSNQIVLMGDIALAQHLQTLIDELDKNYIQAKTQTFRLAYADATEVSENILDLFDNSGSQAGGAGNQRAQQPRRPQRNQAASPTANTVGPEVELRVTVNIQQNSLTVSAEPSIINEISQLIDTEWDLPRSPGTSRIYSLVYTDPLKVADKLNALLGQGGGGTSGSGRRTAGGGAGGGGSSSVDQILQGIYRIEPLPDSNQLIVFCKTEQSLDFLDEVISEIDRPTEIGLPFVTELKHANAVELAEELNALLSEAGAGATIERPEEGIAGRGEGGEVTGDEGAAGTISFPWQRGGGQRDDQSPESSLIGKVRIVPIVRQNALAVLCPAPQRDAVRGLIEYFDRPGRQVMISAIIAEVELNDELALGIRISNSSDILSGGNVDFRVGGVVGVDGTKDNIFSNLFDSSVLDSSVSINAVLQALQEKTNVRILQEPIIFTADNQEAIFFDGQDIPFITNTTINAQGNPNDSFEYREVGVTLNVRPRITVERDVDLEILLELSSVVPGVTLFGGAIVDRRQTRTHVVVQNEQTIVISGILREEESKITRKIPLLGDIPIVGELFKSRDNSTTSTELIAFITPQVVDDPSENDTNFQETFRSRLKALTLPAEEQRKFHSPERLQKHFEEMHPQVGEANRLLEEMDE